MTYLAVFFSALLAATIVPFYSEIAVGAAVLAGHWVPVDRQEMDCGICVNRKEATAVCVPMSDVHTGDEIVVGRMGTRVRPERRLGLERGAFSFMNSNVSSEKLGR